MTNEELIKQIKQLPLERQREIVDAIESSVWETTSSPEERMAIFDRLQGIGKPDTAGEVQVAQEAENGHGTLAQHLYGILQFEGGLPTDEELST